VIRILIMRPAAAGHLAATTTDGMNRRRGHNSAGEWVAHLLPGGLLLPIRRETQRAPQLRELRLEQRREQRLEQRLEQLLEQPAVQRRIEVQVEVKVEVEMERKTQVMTQAIAQPTILPPELGDELRRVLQETQPRFQREVPVARYQVSGARCQDRNDQVPSPNDHSSTNGRVTCPNPR
jgi:hypothetical protein